jgi:hypothetical protein
LNHVSLFPNQDVITDLILISRVRSKEGVDGGAQAVDRLVQHNHPGSGVKGIA